jgi:hypothetical protein
MEYRLPGYQSGPWAACKSTMSSKCLSLVSTPIAIAEMALQSKVLRSSMRGKGFMILKRSRLCLTTFACIGLPALVAAPGSKVAAQVPERLPIDSTYTIGTFESLGLYHKSENLGECKVRFRSQGTLEWKEGLSLWFDTRVKQYRGSLVYLQPGTTYEIELLLGGTTVSLTGKTRAERFPIGKITLVPAGDFNDAITITESGTPDSYHLVTVPAGMKSAIDVRNAAENTVTVNASYVIIRGLELRNAAKHGILIGGGRHDIVIEDCRITGWGRIGGASSYGNDGAHDAAVFAEDGTRNIVVQRNLIEHPRGGSNDWSTGHPAGPEGVTINQSLGGNIIRYNTIRSTEDHGFLDAIGGGNNFSTAGNMNRDSDIYGNYIRNVWDDGLQVEGSNTNVRIWNNYIHQTVQHIATASTTHGPLYIFRNVFGESRWEHADPSGGFLIKTGGRGEFDGGRRFLFHNTSVQPRGAMHVFSGHSDPNAYSRNNLWDVRGMLNRNRPPEHAAKSDFDYEMYTGLTIGLPPMPHRIPTRPRLVESQGLEFYPAAWAYGTGSGYEQYVRADKTTVRVADAVLLRPNPMIDGGIRIPNFNDGFAGKAPDIGAFERGRPPLKFGREGQSFPPAPWE